MAAGAPPDTTMEPSLQPALFDPGSRYLNRELSWLDFDARVLALAEDPGLPLLERVKFLAIYSQNLDEFFQIRVSGLLEQLEAGVGASTPEGMTPGEQVVAIETRVRDLQSRVDRVFVDELTPSLDKAGIRIVSWDQVDETERTALSARFHDQIFPVLTPLSVDPAHPFPYVSSLSLNLAAIVRDPMTGVRRFARVKVPPLLPRFLELEDGERFVPVDQVIAAHLDVLFPGMEIVTHHPFRVTRDADVEVEEDEAEDLLAAIEDVLQRRRRGANPVRLEVDGTMTAEARALLMRELELEERDVYVTAGLIDLSGLWSIVGLDRPDLKEEPWKPITQPRLNALDEAPDLFRVLRQGDVLVHHPYDSFSTSVEAFVGQAALDPAVLAIKQSLYRTSADSPIIRALISAAEAGKQVVALVELKARFDEQANITWARALEQAGVHVVYGVVGLKTHAKTCLIVRREAEGIRRYAHIGTGNYNPSTARLYEDLGLLTADHAIGADLTDLFNLLTGYSRQREYRKLLVAPVSLRQRIHELILREAAQRDGTITLKLNSLADPDMIDALYQASQAGTRVDLIVRGICCLRPGVPGLSDDIRVRSVVGRFLEHSRIFRFGSHDRGHDYYFGSADLMPRNLDRRVEALTPVSDPHLTARLDEILEVNLSDDVLAWELGPEGTWSKIATERGVNTHQRLIEIAGERSRGER
ncbi:MAG: RNA degradosome polyphosphate kinase [Actinomycetota bacterium]